MDEDREMQRKRENAHSPKRTLPGTAVRCVRPDQPANAHKPDLAELSAAVGGVPVCLRASVDDRRSGLTLDAGYHEVSGAQALAFVRQRHGLPRGDLDRIARQQVFLAGATERLLSAGILADPGAVARLADVTSRAVTLDDNWDLLAFVRQVQGFSADAVTFHTVPTGSLALDTPAGTAVEVDPQEVREFVGDVIAGDTPAAQAAPPTPTATASPGVRPAAGASTSAATGAAGASPYPASRHGYGAHGYDYSAGYGGYRLGYGVQPAGPSGPTGSTPSDVPPADITAAAPGCVN